MTEQQKKALRAALPFCRDRIAIPKKGNVDYEDIARQIAALPDADRIRELTAWVLEYDAASAATPNQ